MKSLGLTIVYPTQKTSQKKDYMNGKIIEINEEKVEDHLGNFVMRNSFQETLKRDAGSRGGSVMSGTKTSEKCRTPGLSIRPLSEESPYQSWRCQTQGSETREESHSNQSSMSTASEEK